MPASEVKGKTGDALTALHGGQLQAMANVGSLVVLDTSVDVFLVFTDHDKIHVRMMRRNKGRESADWPNICEEP
jgi:hypothetical protein